MPDVIASSGGAGTAGVDLWASNRDFSLLKINGHNPGSGGGYEVQDTQPISIQFSKPIDTATLTYENIQLDRDGVVLPYSLFSFDEGRQVRIDPIGIERGEMYTVTVRGGSEGLHDLYGNQMDGNNDNQPQESPVDDYSFDFYAVDTTPPTIPSSLNVEPRDGAAILSWAPNGDPILDADLSGYYVVWRETGTDDQNYVLYSVAELGAEPIITIRGLDNSFPQAGDAVEYQFSVVARDETGNESQFSEWVSATPISETPLIWWSGLSDTYVSAANGGYLKMLSYVVDYQNDIDTVEIYWQGEPTGAFLRDDGQHGDYGAGDRIYGLAAPVEPLSPGAVGSYLYELVATDTQGNQSYVWPYFTTQDDKPGEAYTGSYEHTFNAQAHQFMLDTQIPWHSYAPAPDPARRPNIWCAGYQIYPQADYEYGMKHALTAIVIDPDGYNDLFKVELLYDGIFLGDFVDDGTAEDWAPDDMVLGIDLTWFGSENDPGGEQGGHWPLGQVSLQILATDRNGNTSDTWPYFVVNP